MPTAIESSAIAIPRPDIIDETVQTHVKLNINNVKVFFPFEPYETQRQFMQSVVEALEKRKNALLESPTGTGKTLSLLCSSLAWLQSSPNNKSMIFYASRTHIQLSQVAKELKRTAYGRNSAVVLSSRARMCLNDDVKNQPDHCINRACRNAIAKNACSYFSDYENKMKVMNMEDVHDIEDLASFGRRHHCCPYYASKKLAETKASVVFMPYNFLFDQSLRERGQLKLENSVIILDEAHNIESVVRDSVSGSCNDTCLDTIISSCLSLPTKVHDSLTALKTGITKSGVELQKKSDKSGKDRPGQQEKEPKANPIEELASKLTNDKINLVKVCAERLKENVPNMTMDSPNTITKLIHVFKQSGIVYETSSLLLETLDSMASFWSIAGVMSPTLIARYLAALTNMSVIIDLVYPRGCLSLKAKMENEETLEKYYTCYLKGIYEEDQLLKNGRLKDWQLNLWCLHPSVGMRKLMDSCISGPRSIIITSGTLSPIELVGEELGIKFGIIKQFEHVISGDQLKVLLLGRAPQTDYSLESHFTAMQKDAYQLALGKTLIPLFKILPSGTLVFFPSYQFMNTLFKFWRSKSSIWNDMTKATTKLFMESPKQSKKQFEDELQNFKNLLANPGKPRAVMFGVCRGKLSEGVNLEGDQCRSVIMVGLPFPAMKDPKVAATRKFYDTKMKSGGKQWYSRQMIRALNQTIGRVIRSKSDYGSLILCDPRFTEYRYTLSAWVQKFYPAVESNFSTVEHQIKEFYSKHNVIIRGFCSEDLGGAFEVGFSGPTSTPQSSRQLVALPSSPRNPMTAEERRAAMMRSYTVDQETYRRVQDSRQRQINDINAGAPPSKRPTLDDAMNDICPFDEPSQVHPLPDQTSTPQPPVGESSSKEPSAADSSRSTVVAAPPDRQLVQQAPHPQQPTSLPHKSLNIFKMKAKRPPMQSRQSQPIDQSASQATISSHNYSILNDFKKKDRPVGYKCYICLNDAEEPLRTNCTCARVLCSKHKNTLNNQKCGKCQTLLRQRLFKRLLFQSAFHAVERQAPIGAPAEGNRLAQ